MRKIKTAPGDTGLTKVFKSYRYSARNSGREFNLTKEQVKEITSGNCHYCGCPPCQKSICSSKGSTKEAIEHSIYTYNGIDRKDNTKGYTIDNCLTCCVRCNRAKLAMSYEEFVTWFSTLYENYWTLKYEVNHG